MRLLILGDNLTFRNPRHGAIAAERFDVSIAELDEATEAVLAAEDEMLANTVCADVERGDR